MSKDKRSESKSDSNKIENDIDLALNMPPRLKTGSAGLDLITGGGFLVGGTYLLLGSPGAGKTILANQLAFNDTENKRALYVTLLAESHSRMFGHLDTLEFFDRSKISAEILYLSGYDVLEKEGIDGLMKLLASAVIRHKAQVLIVDGIASASDISDGATFKKFVHNLSSVIGISECTTILLSSVHHDRSAPEYTMVDGIISLTLREIGMRSAREIEVQKFRGSQHLYGKHFFDIDPAGIAIYPRVDGVLGTHGEIETKILERYSTGLKSLDSKLDGGFTPNSTTSFLGPAGTGKTSIGMSFLKAGAMKGEHSVLLSLYEHPHLLERKLKAIGMDVEPLINYGKLSILRQDPSEFILDKLVYKLLEHLASTNAKRLLIDGLEGFKDSEYVGNERLHGILNALAAELRLRNVTTIMIEETDTSSTSGPSSKLFSFDSGIFDNVIQFSHAHFEDQRVNVLNVVKTRESDHKSGFYQLNLTADGPALGQSFEFIKPLFPAVRSAKV